MKKLITPLVATLTLLGASLGYGQLQYVKPTYFQIAVTTGTNVVLSSSNNYFYEATIYAMRFVTNNAIFQGCTNPVYIGTIDVPGTLLSTNLPVITTQLTSNQSLTITAPEGVRYNLADYYVVGTTGDKVTIKLLSR